MDELCNQIKRVTELKNKVASLNSNHLIRVESIIHEVKDSERILLQAENQLLGILFREVPNLEEVQITQQYSPYISEINHTPMPFSEKWEVRFSELFYNKRKNSDLFKTWTVEIGLNQKELIAILHTFSALSNTYLNQKMNFKKVATFNQYDYY